VYRYVIGGTVVKARSNARRASRCAGQPASSQTGRAARAHRDDQTTGWCRTSRARWTTA